MSGGPAAAPAPAPPWSKPLPAPAGLGGGLSGRGPCPAAPRRLLPACRAPGAGGNGALQAGTRHLLHRGSPASSAVGRGAGGTSGMWQGLAAGHGQVAAGSPPAPAPHRRQQHRCSCWSHCCIAVPPAPGRAHPTKWIYRRERGGSHIGDMEPVCSGPPAACPRCCGRRHSGGLSPCPQPSLAASEHGACLCPHHSWRWGQSPPWCRVHPACPGPRWVPEMPGVPVPVRGSPCPFAALLASSRGRAGHKALPLFTAGFLQGGGVGRGAFTERCLHFWSFLRDTFSCEPPPPPWPVGPWLF